MREHAEWVARPTKVDGYHWSGSSQYHSEYRAWARGGLTANIYQETKWRFDSSWSSSDYHYIHSQGLNKEDKALRRDVQAQATDVQHLPEILLQAAVAHYPCAPPAQRRQQFSIKGVMTAWQLQLHQEGRILSTDEELKWILEAYGDRYGEAAEELDAQLQALHPRKVNEKWRQHPLQVDQAWSDALGKCVMSSIVRQEQPFVEYLHIAIKFDCSVKALFHMKINIEKTKAILKVIGTLKSKAMGYGLYPAHPEDQREVQAAAMAMMDQELDEFFGEVKTNQGKAQKRRRPEAGSNSVLPFLYQAATLYKAKQKESPTWSVNFQPPRTVLALAMIKELATRLDAVMKDKNRFKEIQDLGWMAQQGAWKFQVWNGTLRHLQEDPERAPLPTQNLKELLEELYKSLKGEVVARFRCTRKLTDTMESQATFFFDISTRGTGQEAWKILMMLQGNCVLQLIGLGYKRAGLRRGPVAEKVRDGDAIAMVLRIELMAAKDVFEPLQPDSPHPSWRHAIFNEPTGSQQKSRHHCPTP
ncbi:unnamed protein product [Symbiodinium microadriaticum]|nr:unnamed protein product [Symbiodinium microadriaticum]